MIHRRRIPLIPLLIGAVCLAIIPAVANAQAGADEAPSTVTRVTLRATVRLGADQSSLTLADLARISGPQSSALQALVIDPGGAIDAGRWSRIPLSAVRAQLGDAPGINDGSLVVTGTDIQITRLAVAPGQPTGEGPKPAGRATSAAPVLRDHIERWIYARLKTTPQTTRLQYTDRDADLLSAPTAGRIVQISEVGRSDRMSLHVVVYEGERVVEDTTVRVGVQIQRRVRVAHTQIKRRTGISADATTLETRWLAPTEPIADPLACLGQVCRNTIDPGTVLLVSMLEPPVVIERGEIISARSLAGSVSVSMSVRALSAGKMGELIELESRDRKQKFTARVSGPGQAVIINDPR